MAGTGLAGGEQLQIPQEMSRQIGADWVREVSPWFQMKAAFVVIDGGTSFGSGLQWRARWASTTQVLGYMSTCRRTCHHPWDPAEWPWSLRVTSTAAKKPLLSERGSLQNQHRSRQLSRSIYIYRHVYTLCTYVHTDIYRYTCEYMYVHTDIYRHTYIGTHTMRYTRHT
jgi:hypothetical protein